MQKLEIIKDVWRKYNFILTTSQKKWGIVVVIMTLLGALCETLGVSIILPLVQVMIEPQQLRENEAVSPIIDMLKLDTDTSLIWAIGGSVIFVYFFKNVFLALLSYVRVKYACKVQRELSVEMLDSYMKRGYVFFLNVGTGELVRGMINGIFNTYTGLYQIFRLIAEVMTIIFICIYIMLSDIFMAFCVICLAVVCLLLVLLVCQKQVKKCGEIYYKYSGLINQSLIQTFQSIKEILVMHRQEFFINSYRRKYQEQQKGFIGQTVAAESPAYVIETICVGGLIIAVCIKAITVKTPALLVPQLAAFAVAAFRILPSLGRISNYFSQFIFCVPGINDTYQNLKEVRRANGVIRQDFNEKKKNDIQVCFDKKISVENVTWRYPMSVENVLENISLDIKKGQSVAFVGKSGAGKTTLADVILGLLKPKTGNIKIDGVNIADISEKSSKLIGFVPQNANLQDDTVRRNVAFGIEDDKIEDSAVWMALEQAQMKAMIEELPEGLDTQIGERGIRFSGGQRQRFAIARALYNNPDILIFDEATSALDTDTENAVMEAINALQGHKTLIIIAHRLSTIRNCDVIYEIRDGKAYQRRYEDLI